MARPELTARLERLVRLHASGAVSDEEFIEQSKGLVGSETTDSRSDQDSEQLKADEESAVNADARRRVSTEVQHWAQHDDRDWWYKEYDYYPTGPVKAKQLVNLLDSGDIHENTMVWCSDLTDWMPYCQAGQHMSGRSSKSDSPVGPQQAQRGSPGSQRKTSRSGATGKRISYAAAGGAAVLAVLGWLTFTDLGRGPYDRLWVAGISEQTPVTGASAAVDRSKLCRTSAASRWLLDFSFYNTRPTLDETLERLKQAVIYAEAIRQFCGDNQINLEVQQAAQRGTEPDWIEGDIATLKDQMVRDCRIVLSEART